MMRLKVCYKDVDASKLHLGRRGSSPQRMMSPQSLHFLIYETPPTAALELIILSSSQHTFCFTQLVGTCLGQSCDML